MIKPYSKEIEAQMQELYSRLPEKSRRLYARVEALKLPYGGISYIADVFACLFNQVYETGRKVVVGFKESMRIVFEQHLGQWTYVAMPKATISEVA